MLRAYARALPGAAYAQDLDVLTAQELASRHAAEYY
jgi:hypothetical protein